MKRVDFFYDFSCPYAYLASTQIEALRACTAEAVARGVFGAPAFVVTAPGVAGDLYWGQDRLDFVEKALGGWSVKEGTP